MSSLPPGLRALESRRFRTTLLVLAGVPLLAGYLVQTVLPVLISHQVAADAIDYLAGARALAAGRDPYSAHLAVSGFDRTVSQGYVYPAVLAWSMRPLAGWTDSGVSILAVAGLQACLVAFLVVAGWVLRMRGLERWLFAALLVACFTPTRLNLYSGQVNPLLLLLSAVWLAGWVAGDRWWGGAAVGVGVAVKVLQAPLLGLMLWGRRWVSGAATLLTVAALWLIPGPGYLVEYWLRVFPTIIGTGFRENQSPTGLLIRLLQPSSFYGQLEPIPVAARIGGAAFALLVVGVSWATLWNRRPDRVGRVLEASVALTALPLLAPLVWPHHLVLLLLPILVLIAVGLDTRDLRLVGLALCGWALIGFGQLAVLSLVLAGVDGGPLIRVLAETGVAGAVLLWLTAIVALRAHRAPAPA